MIFLYCLHSTFFEGLMIFPFHQIWTRWRWRDMIRFSTWLAQQIELWANQEKVLEFSSMSESYSKISIRFPNYSFLLMDKKRYVRKWDERHSFEVYLYLNERYENSNYLLSKKLTLHQQESTNFSKIIRNIWLNDMSFEECYGGFRLEQFQYFNARIFAI